MKWIEFDKATGRILQCVEGSAVLPPSETDAIGLIMDETASAAEAWVNPATGRLENRPENTGVCEVNGPNVSFAGFESGAVISRPGDLVITESGNVITRALDSGTHVFEVSQFPAKDARFEITI